LSVELTKAHSFRLFFGYFTHGKAIYTFFMRNQLKNEKENVNGF